MERSVHIIVLQDENQMLVDSSMKERDSRWFKSYLGASCRCQNSKGHWNGVHEIYDGELVLNS